MAAYDLTMKPIFRLEILWLLEQLIDHRVIRINFD